jgi:hypothetical protein
MLHRRNSFTSSVETVPFCGKCFDRRVKEAAVAAVEAGDIEVVEVVGVVSDDDDDDDDSTGDGDEDEDDDDEEGEERCDADGCQGNRDCRSWAFQLYNRTCSTRVGQVTLVSELAVAYDGGGEDAEQTVGDADVDENGNTSSQ